MIIICVYVDAKYFAEKLDVMLKMNFMNGF